MRIDIPSFKGIIPRTAPKLLPEEAAQTADNVDLLSGRLSTIKDSSAVTTISASQTTLYKYGSTWLTWEEDVDVIRGPINEDEYERIYYTGDDDGKLKVRGTFGERDAEVTQPAAITSTAATKKFVSTTPTCLGYGGASFGSVACAHISTVETDNGFRYKYRYPGQYTDAGGAISGCLLTTYQLTIPEGSVPSTLSCNINTINGQTLDIEDDNNEKYASFQVTSTKKSNTDDSYSPAGATATIKPHDIEFKVNMNYIGFEDSFYYVRSAVLTDGSEGPPSELSPMVTRRAGEEITITMSDLSAVTNIDVQRIYRSASGTKEDDFFFLAEVSKSTTSYVDDVRDSELAESIPAYGNPPDDLVGLISLPGGFWAAFKGQDLYFSEPFLPHIAPTKYNMTVDYDIVGLGVSGNDLIVCTEGNPYLVSGSHPSVLTQTKLMLNQSCISKRSICQVGRNVLYASPDGMVMVRGGSGELITEKFYTRTQWQALNPSSMQCEVRDKKLYAFTSSDSFIMDFDEGIGALTTITQSVDGLYSDLEDDILYYIDGTALESWETSATDLLITWKSKRFKFQKPVNWSCARVIADSYSAVVGDETKLLIYANGVLVHTQICTSEAAFRIPDYRPEMEWSLEVQAKTNVDRIVVSTSMEEI